MAKETAARADRWEIGRVSRACRGEKLGLPANAPELMFHLGAAVCPIFEIDHIL